MKKIKTKKNIKYKKRTITTNFAFKYRSKKTRLYKS